MVQRTSGLTIAQQREAAEILVNLNGTADKIEALPPNLQPDDLAEAYAVQQQAHGLLAQRGKAYGWKIGATNQAARVMVGSEAPFYGRMFDHTRWQNGAQIAFSNLGMTVIEPEFAFELGADLPTGASLEDTQAAISRVVLSIEVVSSRFRAGLGAGVLNHVMDNGVHHGWVEGPSSFDWRDLEAVNVTLLQNSETVATGSGAAVEGGPVSMVTWLANQGVALKAGDIITTGTTVKPPFGAADDQFEAIFEGLGSVRLSLT